MVIVKHATQTIVPPSVHPEQYQLITLVIGAPAPIHKAESETQARPFEFVFDLPSRFSAMCPFCTAGFYVSATDITEQFNCKFTWCPECGVGKPEPPKQIPPFIDPFVNPFDSKQLYRCELDETITSVANIFQDDSLTVAQKMSRTK
jgi:hypothetical protein